MSETKLIPCPNPWCPAETPPKRVLTNYHMEFGNAIRCECGVIGPSAPTADGAISAWNTRTPDPRSAAADEVAKALKEAVELITECYPRPSMDDGYWPAVKPIVERLDTALAAYNALK